MAEHRPVLFGIRHHQVAFDFYRIGRAGVSPMTAAEPADVRIHGDAGHAKGVAQNHVRRLATHPGSGTNSSIVPGTWPPCCSTSTRQQAMMLRALLRKKPVD